MTDLFSATATGFTAFTATNLDDIVVLLLFFSQVDTVLRRRHIVTGQYLGFTLLVLISLPGFFGSLLLPQAWVGVLGIVPLAIGISRLLNREDDVESEAEASPSVASLASFLSPQTYGVAATTIANGSDNIGIYVPLFAHCTWTSLTVILGVFFSLVAAWCYAAYRLTQVPAIASTLTRYGSSLVPFVLMGLGIMILVESHTLEEPGLMAITGIACCACLMTLNRNLLRSPQ